MGGEEKKIRELKVLLGNSLQSEIFVMTGPLIKFYTVN